MADPTEDPSPAPAGGADAPAPRVSVVVAFRNARSTVAETIASIRAQTVTDWEALLVDDHSTDGSSELVARLAAEDPRLRHIRLSRRKGAGSARNLGIRLARGRWIAFLDADDVWLPRKLECQLPLLEAGADIVFSSYRRITPDGRPLGVVRARPRVTYLDALGGNPIGSPTGIWSVERFGRAQMPEGVSMHEDYPFWLSLLRQGGVAQGVPEILAEYRVSPNSLSARKWKAARHTWAVLRREPGLGLPRVAWSFLLYALRALRRRL